MDAAEPASATGLSTISFGDVVIDLHNYEIVRAGDLVSVEPQVFDVLRYLIEHRDRVVSKEELLDNVWGDRFVSESALTSRVKSARQAVGDDGRRQEIIRTTHGRGYRFVAEVIQATEDDTPEPTATPAAGPTTNPVAGTASLAVASADGAQENGLAKIGVARIDDAEQVASVPLDGKVPAPARPLVARDQELTALIGLLEANRLVTVLGPGGVGKTRLATEVAIGWNERADDSAFFAALATVSAPDQVMVAVRDALGVDSGPSADVIGAIGEALAGKSALLVLDNFEHVIDAATGLGDLVQTVPGLRLLVTSRERLGLAGEQVLKLEPFSLAADGSAESSAVTFFEHAVSGVGSEVNLDAEQRDDVMAICQTLDGLPLAMELAAAQTRYYSMSYLRSHLESAAITVADRARDRPERHHTMQSTLAWSYQLLTPRQQQLLASLSVFKGSWPLDAAATMAGDEEPGAAAHDLLALVDKSLVRRSDGVGGEPRFAMLHLLREFAGSQLEALGTGDDALRRHATVVGATVQTVETTRWGDGGDAWIHAMNAEYADAVAALTWCFNGGDPEIGCQIVRALGYWWYRTGRLGEGRVWVDHALGGISAADDATAAWIHSAAGKLAAYELRRDEASERFETALSMAREMGDRRLEALSLCHMGELPAEESEDTAGGTDGDPSEIESVERGLELARTLASPQLITYGLTVLGELSRATGDPERAEAAYREGLDVNVRLGDRHYTAINTLNLGWVTR